MKKFLIATVVLLGSISFANAEQFRVGISVMGAVMEADGAKEMFSGDHSSNTTSTKRTINASDEKENAEGAFALGSVFAEFQATDQISVGLSYVPHSSDTETAQNVQNMGTSFTAEATASSKSGSTIWISPLLIVSTTLGFISTPWTFTLFCAINAAVGRPI